ncbi:MAG: hypothetical protein R3343_13640, partial [Nitriliruptorales bacterium]|nr:hypothetical protein [Nitriliruptorales bacterium]
MAGQTTDPLPNWSSRMIRSRYPLVTSLAALTLFALAAPVSAITKGGSPDNGEHPYVGVMVAYSDQVGWDHDGDPDTPDLQVQEPLWRCSGALVSPTVFVTAGHCTGPASSDPEEEAVPALAAIWFDEGPDAFRFLSESNPNPDWNGYPFYESAPYTGLPEAHPSYNPDAFYLHDAGVVVLDEDGNDVGSYAQLPQVGALDGLGKGRKRATLEAVGYGLQLINPVFIKADVERRKADLFIVDDTGVLGLEPFLPGTSVMVSGDAKHGGTC